MELLVCYCLQCNSELARFSNSWDAIGTNYHSPVQSPISVVGLKATGASYGAAPESTIEHSSLQDVACIKCRKILGLQCYSAPLGHLLMKDQLILNLALMSVVSASTGRPVQISVLRSVPLIKASGKRPAASRRSSTAQPVKSHSHSMPPPPRPLVPASSASISKLSTVGESRFSLPPATVASPSEAEKFKSWVEIAIRNQQKDIDRVSGTIDRIERDVQFFKDSITEFQAELASNRESRTRHQEELKRLRHRVEENERRPRSRGSNEISKRSLEAITEDILQVNQKANEVDEVKEEVEKLRARLSELEQIASNRALVQSQNTTSQPSTKPNHDQVNDLFTPVSESLSPPKRPSKRRRVSNRSAMNESTSTERPSQESRAHFGIPEVTELSSSEHKASPLVDQSHNNEEDQVDTQNHTAANDVPRESEPTFLPRLRSSRIEVCIPARPGDTQRQLQDTTSETGNIRSKSDVKYTIPRIQGARRNSKGFLVTTNSKVNRRSLRKKKDAAQKEDGGPGQRNQLSDPAVAEEAGTNEDTHIGDDIERAKNVDSYEVVDDPFMAVDAQLDEDTNESINSRDAEIMPSVEAKQSTPFRPRSIPLRDSTALLEGNIFKFGSCNKRYSTSHALDFHHDNTTGCADRAKDKPPRRLTDDKPFKCGVCGKKYGSLNALDYHHKHSNGCDNTENDSFPTCPSCGKVYKVIFRPERVHIEIGACNLNGSSSDVNSPLQKCNACGKPFKTSLELEEHKCSRVKLHSLNFREASLAAREVVLIERERLVRQTLERELGNLWNKRELY